MSFKLIKPDSPDQTVDSTSARVFLAGSIDNGKAAPWADGVAEKISDFDAAAFNPLRNVWWPDLEARMHEPKFAQQVNWELNNIDLADIVFFYFAAGSVSPITLQELGYVLGQGVSGGLRPEVVVCCPDGFWRKGNVEIMCFRSEVEVHNNLEEAIGELRQLLRSFIVGDALRQVRSELKNAKKVGNETLTDAYFQAVQDIRRRMNDAKIAALREAEKPFLEELREIEEEHAITLKLAS